jgi:hypothetical protein
MSTQKGELPPPMPNALPQRAVPQFQPMQHNDGWSKAWGSWNAQSHRAAIVPAHQMANTPLVLLQSASCTVPQHLPEADGYATIYSAVVQMQGLAVITTTGMAELTDATPKPAALKPRIVRVPGARLETGLRFLLPQRAFEWIVEPLLIDARREYIESLARGNSAHAWFVKIRLCMQLAYRGACALLGWWDRLTRRGAG